MIIAEVMENTLNI